MTPLLSSQEFTLKLPNISWCQNLVVRTEPGKGSNTQNWKLDWIQIQFPDCNSVYFAPCKAWIQKGDPALTLSAMVSAPSHIPQVCLSLEFFVNWSFLKCLLWVLHILRTCCLM
jgi:hypothetical protein